MRVFRILVLATVALSSSACDFEDTDTWLENPEDAFQDLYYSTPISLSGRVIAPSGRGLTGVEVAVGDTTTTTDSDGRFLLQGLPRKSALVTFSSTDHRTELVATWLHRPIEELELVLDPVVMRKELATESRLLFTGDVSMGRRFLWEDPQIDALPPGDQPGALIRISDPTESTKSILTSMRPFVQAADFTSINLETVVTDEPDTPFDEKPYVFYTLPGSIPALQWMGVDYAALGNNHIYDYLEKGVVDTMGHLTAAGLPFSGAGSVPFEAFEPYRTTVGQHALSFVSVSSIDGRQYPRLFIANDEQGGGAYAWDTERYQTRLNEERAVGRIPIVNMHTGSEYTENPIESSHERMRWAVENGAAMVVAHHPHIAQGFEWYQGRLIAHSLGNFVFDQKRLETLLGATLRVDIEQDEVKAVRVTPVYNEDYLPRPVSGSVANVFLRRLAQASQHYGATLVPYQSQGWLLNQGESPLVETYTVDIEVDVSQAGVGYVDLRQHARDSSHFLAATTIDGNLTGEMGRDILVFGEMEDVDTDDDTHEISRWYTTGGSSFPCLHDVNRGSIALCSYRTERNRSGSVINFRNRIRVLGNATDTPQKDLTFVGWLNGENAGRVTIDAAYYAPLGSREFGSESVFDATLGTQEWAPIFVDLHMPSDDPSNPKSRTENPRALRIFMNHYGPTSGAGMFRIDDLAVVSWQGVAHDTLDGPHPYDFIRVRGPAGSYPVRLTFQRWLPPTTTP